MEIKAYRSFLSSFNFDCLDSVLLFIYACLNKLDKDKVNISQADLYKLIAKKVVSKNILSGELLINIKTPIDEDIEINLEAYRNLFDNPNARKGIKGKKQAVIKNLKEWLIKNKEYTMKDILEASSKYLETENYPRNADYFIYKVILRDSKKVRVSELDEVIALINKGKDNPFTRNI
jgi:hypothetical protein